MWRPRWTVIRAQLKVGLPIGVMYGADVLGLALSQMMIAQTSAIGRRGHADRHGADVDGLHADHRHRARGHDAGGAVHRRGQPRLGQPPRQRGHRAVRGADGLRRRAAARRRALGVAAVREQRRTRRRRASWRWALVLLWPAAAYQIFDGLYCGASFCLRGAGDTRVPAATALVLSWFLFVPLAHTLIFAPGQGWIDGLPQYGLGAKRRLARADDLRDLVRLRACSGAGGTAPGAACSSVTRASRALPDRRARAGMLMIGP